MPYASWMLHVYLPPSTALDITLKSISHPNRPLASITYPLLRRLRRLLLSLILHRHSSIPITILSQLPLPPLITKLIKRHATQTAQPLLIILACIPTKSLLPISTTTTKQPHQLPRRPRHIRHNARIILLHIRKIPNHDFLNAQILVRNHRRRCRQVGFRK